MARIAVVSVVAAACATLPSVAPVEYGVQLGETGPEQRVTDVWPPRGPVVDTTRADEAYCWQNFSDVSPGRRSGGCAPTPTASGRFEQAARPTACPGAMQPAIVGFTPAHVSVWTCLPGCGPGDEYVTQFGQELAYSDVHFTLRALCTTTCAPGSHRAAYATAFGDAFYGGVAQAGDCVAGDPDPAAAAALVDEQARQRDARDRSVAAAFAEVDALTASAGGAHACSSPDKQRVEDLLAALRQLRDQDVVARYTAAKARWDGVVRALPPPPPPPRVAPPDTCTPGCYAQQQQCFERCGSMSPAVCATCASATQACVRACVR